MVVEVAAPEAKGDKSHQKGWCVKFIQDLVLGGAVASILQSATTPFDRVKLFLAIQYSVSDISSATAKPYSGVVDCFQRVSAEQGVGAFWRGNLVNCLRYAPQQGCALAFNDLINSEIFPKYSAETDFWKSFGLKLLAGGSAGAIANTICYPFDFSRARRAVKTQTFTQLYAGFPITVAGAFVYRAGQLGGFTQIQEFNPYKQDKGILGAVSSFAAVTTSRTLVIPFEYPLATIRRRMMLQKEKPVAERQYTNAFHCFASILKKEGVRNIYRGVNHEFVGGVGGSLVVVAYDRIKLILNL